MLKTRLTALLLLVVGLALGYFDYNTNDRFPFALGLDLSGGSQLVYRADMADVEPSTESLSIQPEDQARQAEIDDRLSALQDVILRRVSSQELAGALGVLEPNVQTEVSRLAGSDPEYRVIVELPGVTDIDQAVAMIGQTPLLEFKLENPDFEIPSFNVEPDEDGNVVLPEIDFSNQYLDTELTGRYLKRATLQFSQGFQGGHSGLAGEPIVAITFDNEGSRLFEEITTENVGQVVAIFLDGTPISTPIVQQPISGGEAVITGQFTPDEARQLVGRLNSGALPVDIELISTQTIGASLGADAIEAGIMAGIYGFILVSIFLILWYRVPGILATLALGIYSVAMLALFKLIPVTLTSAGIAGFIISLGIAVDANILIFERMKEELLKGQSIYDAIRVGFQRAWASIRDANISSLISAGILLWFGSTLIRGFALTFGLGVFISMITAITVTRFFLLAVSGRTTTRVKRWLMQSGLNK